MKWINHKLIAGATGLALTHSIAFSSVAILFATVPDAAEIHNYRTNTSIFKHRGNSHNPLVWLAVFVLVYAVLRFKLPAIIASLYPVAHFINLNPDQVITDAYWGALWGIFVHLATDAMTPGGIPIGKHKFTMSLFYTGSQTEYAVAFAIAIASGLVIYVTHGEITI